MTTGFLLLLSMICGLAVVAGCQEEEIAPTMELTAAIAGDEASQAVAVRDGTAKMDNLLRVMLYRQVTPDNVRRAVPGKLGRARVGARQGRQVVTVDVFIHADRAAIPHLESLGARIRTVTESGIMTATVPLDAVAGMASRDDV
jgi:hypothetical protein